MPNFKPKAKKKFKMNKKSTITLDSKHNEKMKLFDDIEKNQIPQLNARKKELENFLKSTQNIEEKLNMEDEIKDINIKIKVLKKKRRSIY